MSELKFQSAKQSMGKGIRWEEVGDDSKSTYIGDTVEGEFVRRSEDVGPNDSNIYHIKTKEHGLVDVWGTTLLDSCMLEGNEGGEVPIGAIVRIVCLGKRQGKTGPSKQEGKGYWAFDVQFAIPSPAFKAAKSSGEALAVGGMEAKTEKPVASEDEYS